MNSYTVKQIADMLKTNEETVRRWIRSGKLVATQDSKKTGNVISSESLKQFIKKTPKYAPIVAASFVSTPIAMSFVVGSLLGSLYAMVKEKDNESVTSKDVENFLKKKIAIHKKQIEKKEEEIKSIQEKIEEDKQNIEKYQFALDNLDLESLANEINKE